MKKSKLPLDKRLNWRDPNMPVLRMAKARLPNGTYEDEFTMQEVKPEHSQEYHRWKLQNINDVPTWRNDPTYFLKKSK